MDDVTILSSRYVRAACSRASDPQSAVRDVRASFTDIKIGFVLFFCSAEYPLDALADCLSAAFGNNVIGCTSAGEVTPNGYQDHSLTVLVFSAEYFGISARLIAPIDHCDLADCQHIVADLEEECRSFHPGQGDNNSFAITLLDGLSAYEEIALLALNTALGRIPHFGGSAAADAKNNRTYVYHGGRFHTHAAVVALFTTVLPFSVFSMHHLRDNGGKLVVTEADPASRRVVELNAAPAIEEYARQIDVPVDKVTMETFALYPLAIRLGDRYFIRSIQRVMSDGSLIFYAAVETGVVLSTMQSNDMLQQFSERLEQIENEVGEVQLTIGFDCFLRRLESESRHQLPQISQLQKRFRVVGFNTYGEQFEGVHINQTFTGVVIGSGEQS